MWSLRVAERCKHMKICRFPDTQLRLDLRHMAYGMCTHILQYAHPLSLNFILGENITNCRVSQFTQYNTLCPQTLRHSIRWGKTSKIPFHFKHDIQHDIQQSTTKTYKIVDYMRMLLFLEPLWLHYDHAGCEVTVVMSNIMNIVMLVCLIRVSCFKEDSEDKAAKGSISNT